jgi:hypothetical protein
VTEQLAEPDFDSLDPYSVLGVPEQANTRQIKKTFQKLSKQYHPDRLPSLPNQQDAHTTFTPISNAYEILMDPDKRREHDLKLLAFHTVIINAPKNVDDEDSLNQDDPEDKLHSSTRIPRLQWPILLDIQMMLVKILLLKLLYHQVTSHPHQMILLRIRVMIMKMVHVQNQHDLVGKF